MIRLVPSRRNPARSYLAAARVGGLLLLLLGVNGNIFCQSVPTVTGIVAWGTFAQRLTNFPGAVTSIVAVSLGGSTALALKSDSTVSAWVYYCCTFSNVPPDLTNVVAVATGEFHGVALKNDGTLVAWGASNAVGLTNVPPTATNVVAIAVAGVDSFALR